MNDLDPKTIHIVVVEDENIVALDIERSLKKFGYDVIAVLTSGEEALVAVEKNLPDLVLMDIQLKGEMTGIEAASEIQKKYNIPVIFLTAYADESTFNKAKESEPYGYILKPFEEADLHTTIEVTLKKHKYFLRKESVLTERFNENEDMFELFIESVKDYAIYILDKEGRVTSWNAGAARICGYSADEVIGKPFSFFYSKNGEGQSIDPDEILLRALKHGRYIEEGWRTRKDSVNYWASETLTAIFDKNGKHYGFGKVIHDLTKQKNEEEALKKAIESRDEFLSIAAHELKTPLSILKLQSQMLMPSFMKEKLFSKEKLEQFAELTIKQVQRLTLLVEDMVDVSRIRSGRLTLAKEKCNLRELISELIERYKDKFVEAGCGTPQFNYTTENVVGNWDKIRLEQVINNLFNNIILYARGNPVSVNLKMNNSEAQLEVKDYGAGISKENLKKIFNRFERAVDPNEASGLGLGLYISSQIINAHHGKIWANSEVGKGSTFYVNLPIG